MLYFAVILAAVILAVVVGGVKGKSIDLYGIRLQKTWLIIIAFLVQTITRLLGISGVGFVLKYSLITQVVVFTLLFVCFWFNKKYIGLWFVGLGASLNAMVMLINGGRMPVSMEAMQRVGVKEGIDMIVSGMDNKHTVLDSTTRLGFLADIIYLPGFIGWGMWVISIGDLVVALGMFIFIFELCMGSMKQREKKCE